MHMARVGRLCSIVALYALAAMVLAGCPGNSDSGTGAAAAKGTSGWEGTWQSTQDANMEVQIMPNHKAILKDQSGPKEMTWEMANDDKLVVRGELANLELLRNQDGTLRDMLGGVWKRKG